MFVLADVLASVYVQCDNYKLIVCSVFLRSVRSEKLAFYVEYV